jgi:hypothetical protein
MTARSLCLLFPLILLGCNSAPIEKTAASDRLETDRYIALIEKEILSMDKATNKAITPLVSGTINSASHKKRLTIINEQLKSARNQVETASQLFESKEISTRLPKNIRYELIEARDNAHRAYQIKLKSLDHLARFLKIQDPYALQEYKKLSGEAKHKLDEATASLNKAHATARQ